MRSSELCPYSRTDQRVAPILLQEGISLYPFPPGIQKSQRLIDSSLRLYGFILPDQDFRWQVAYGFLRSSEAGFSRQNFENALEAVYLSKMTSRRNGEPTTVSEENVRQVARAVQSLGARKMLEDRFAANTPTSQPDSLEFQFCVTDRIQEDKKALDFDRPTPCPEALYQLRLFYKGHYLARIGFNIHREGESTIGSITNIQGRKEGCDLMKDFKHEFGILPFNLLILRLKVLASAGEDPIQLRGLRNPRHSDSSGLYNAVLKREGIPRFSREDKDHFYSKLLVEA